MLNSLQYWLGLQPWRTQQTVWGDVLSYHADQRLISLLFTTNEGLACDPQFLSKWGWQVRAMHADLYPPRTGTDHTLQRWVKSQPIPNRVTHLLGETDLGFDLFGATLTVDDGLLPPDYDDADLNGGLVQLNLAGPTPKVLGAVGALTVAQQRLASLFRIGSKPLVAARVQANQQLYAPGRCSAAGMVVFSFDPAVPPAKLEEVAEMIFELKTSDTQNPVLLAAAAGPRASDAYWFYHRRFRIPPQLADGRAVYAGDLWMPRIFLRDGFLSARTPRLMPILAQPGDTGGIELLPLDRLGEFFPPAQVSLFEA